MIDEKRYSHWFNYNVNESKAFINSQCLDVAVFKINDIAQCFAFGNYMLYAAERQGTKEMSGLLLKMMYAENSLLFFSSCIEYLRQMIFLLGRSDAIDLYNHKKFENLLKQKRLSTVANKSLKSLSGRDKNNEIKYENVRKRLVELDKLIQKLGLIEIGNYIKHRGQFYIEGICGNSHVSFGNKITMCKNIDGEMIRIEPKSLLYRETIKLGDFVENLSSGYESLCEAFNDIITFIIPSEYKTNKPCNILDLLRCFETGDTFVIGKTDNNE